VKRNATFFVVVLLLALVPLRALAAVTGGLCANYGGSAVGADVAHHHSAANGETSPQGDTDGTSSACSLCTACCTGASFAAEAPAAVALADGHPELIPFHERRPVPPHPDNLDRPPLSR
jgi:hypothetical protein